MVPMSARRCPPNNERCLSLLLDDWSPDVAEDAKDVCTLARNFGTCEAAFRCELARAGSERSWL